MRQYTQIIISVLILCSCGQKQNKATDMVEVLTTDTSTATISDYSDEFFKYFQKNKLTLKSDSILFPAEIDSEVVLIPQYIPKNQEITFATENGHTLTIRQLNYTDIKFIIQYNDKEFKGKASLLPHFYLGMETVDFSDDEFIITHYYVTETDNPCIDFIGLGNQNIIKENSENVYALVSISGDTCTDELDGLTNKKLKTVGNSP